MKVAFVTTDRVNVNAHFGGAKEVDVYEVSSSGYEFLHTLDFETGAKKLDKQAENESNVIDLTEYTTSSSKQGKKNQDKAKKGKDDESDGKITRKIAVISDCTIVFVASVGGIAAAKVIKNGIMLVKPRSEEEENIDYILNRLVETLKGNPPPWLRKALQEECQDVEAYPTVN